MSVYHSKATLHRASVTGLASGGVGLAVAALENAMASHSRGAAGILTRSGGTIGFFAAMGATFAFTESFVANQRQKDDLWNGAAGACAAGFLAGIKSRSLPAALGGCAILGTVMAGYDHIGGVRIERAPEESRRASFFKTPRDEVAAPPLP